MLLFARKSDVGRTPIIASDEEATLLRMEERLPPMLSVIAGMVDLTGFFMLAIFSRHTSPAISWSQARFWCVEAR
jgi:hypothetical protein